MSIELTTDAEKRALNAQNLSAFGGLNLLHIKRQVASLLGLIGRGSIFDQYTKHDISHIEEMLRSLDWIIPESTKAIMSDADWLMIVLAVYFHDLGMLVTKDEFDSRADSGFPAFCEEHLFVGPSGSDYKAKIKLLPENDRDRFLYQEFVRFKHAERIRTWIIGQDRPQLGSANAAISEVSKLLEPIGPQFRRDLGIVCESHHFDDLGDIDKYKLSQPYGNSDAETVNLQYTAVILRTADLLHITSDRTPSIEFRTINPNDPVSQLEWAKQMAVKRVRSKWGENEDGELEETAPRDTVEVHAYFTREDGFFGLTSYLAYAGEQLKKSYDWIGASNKRALGKHEFPWRRIDDSHIETEGFIRDAFEFTIDQAKILDLLTGHTLYNDTNVVLRELVQNAIDAIRLNYFPASPRDKGKVSIAWSSTTRVLSVQDNGTGMTQEIINNFLLKVGSSRYQDPEFIKKNPEFSSISRFGIGVLSAFMIADNVEVITCHPDDDQARRLSLRSVHGKYLIRLLDKNDEDPALIGSHGTIFRLHVRPSVEMENVYKTARHWIVVPDCSVTVQIDDNDPQNVGFQSTAEALRGFLKESEMDFYETTEKKNEESDDRHQRVVRIVEKTIGDISLSYALTWDRWFKEWSFLSVSSIWRRDLLESGKEEEKPVLGTCVEGIRIVPDSPGFEGFPIVALANVRGQSAPKTNVARSGLEGTSERDEMLKVIYSIYAEHVITELAELTTERSFSPTWATGETRYLLAPLLEASQSSTIPLNSKLLHSALSNIPCIMVEDEGKRAAWSPKKLAAASEFWTIECGLLSSAESLIREVASAASLSELVKTLNVTSFDFPSAPVVCGTSQLSEIVENVFSQKEVNSIVADPHQRRVDFRWVTKSSPPRWLEIPTEHQRVLLMIMDRFSDHRYYTSSLGSRMFDGTLPKIPGEGIEASIPSGETAVRAFGSLYLVPETPLALFAGKSIREVQANPSNENLLVAIAVLGTISQNFRLGRLSNDSEGLRKNMRIWDEAADYLQVETRIEDLFDFNEMINIMKDTNWKCFDPAAWTRDKYLF